MNPIKIYKFTNFLTVKTKFCSLLITRLVKNRNYNASKDLIEFGTIQHKAKWHDQKHNNLLRANFRNSLTVQFASRKYSHLIRSALLKKKLKSVGHPFGQPLSRAKDTNSYKRQGRHHFFYAVQRQF